jgi:ligand-binding SRPBCC domain-containing protein
MKIYTLKRTQFLPITQDEGWAFFSSPHNLAKITPMEMGFKIQYASGVAGQMYAGQIIRYKIRVFPLVTVQWVTEITHAHAPNYFVDEQRLGPYAMWHHQHHFKAVDGGLEMTDEVNYGLPLGLLGKLAHWLFVGQRVNAIFDYRFKVLRGYFGVIETKISQQG